jgi:hypothetical protein
MLNEFRQRATLGSQPNRQRSTAVGDRSLIRWRFMKMLLVLSVRYFARLSPSDGLERQRGNIVMRIGTIAVAALAIAGIVTPALAGKPTSPPDNSHGGNPNAGSGNNSGSNGNHGAPDSFPGKGKGNDGQFPGGGATNGNWPGGGHNPPVSGQ